MIDEQLMIKLILWSIVILLLLSYVLQVLWNGPVQNAFGNGIISTIDYKTALGLFLFLAIFIYKPQQCRNSDIQPLDL